MRSNTRITRKATRESATRRNEPTIVSQKPTRRMTTKALIAEAEEIAARMRHLTRPEANSLAFELVMRGVPVHSIELNDD